MTRVTAEGYGLRGMDRNSCAPEAAPGAQGQPTVTTCCGPEGLRSSRSAAARAGFCHSGPSSGLDPSGSDLSGFCYLDSDCSSLNSQLVEQPFIGLHSSRGNTHASLGAPPVSGSPQAQAPTFCKECLPLPVRITLSTLSPYPCPLHLSVHHSRAAPRSDP